MFENVTSLIHYHFQEMFRSDLAPRIDETDLALFKKELNDAYIDSKLGEWSAIQKQIQDSLLKSSKSEIERFLKIPIVSGVFHPNHQYFGAKYFNKMKTDSLGFKYLNTLTEDVFGSPYLLNVYPLTSPQRVQHLYHLFYLYKSLNLDFSQFSKVVEFGGGYGGFSRLIVRIFENLNELVIVDLPLMHVIQKFYLKNTLNENLFKQKISFRNSQESITGNHKSLFIATWSISETPLEFRESYLENISDYGGFLFSFQKNWGQVNNLTFFKKLQLNLNNEGFETILKECEIFKGNFYFLGKKI